MTIFRSLDGVRMAADTEGVELHRWYGAEELVGQRIKLTFEEVDKLAAFVADVAPRERCSCCRERNGTRSLRSAAVRS